MTSEWNKMDWKDPSGLVDHYYYLSLKGEIKHGDSQEGKEAYKHVRRSN